MEKVIFNESQSTEVARLIDKAIKKTKKHILKLIDEKIFELNNWRDDFKRHFTKHLEELKSRIEGDNEKSKEHECPICGEYLVLHRGGTMTNQKTGEFIYVYICEECNQAFALDNDENMKLLPYDAERKKIENKCKVCKKIENYNEKGLFLLNIDTAYYEFHCFDCAIPILQDWIDKNGKKKIKVTEKNAHEIYEVYDFNRNNEMLQELQKNPKKYKKTMDKFKEGLDKLKQEVRNSSQP